MFLHPHPSTEALFTELEPLVILSVIAGNGNVRIRDHVRFNVGIRPTITSILTQYTCRFPVRPTHSLISHKWRRLESNQPCSRSPDILLGNMPCNHLHHTAKRVRDRGRWVRSLTSSPTDVHDWQKHSTSKPETSSSRRKMPFGRC